MGVALVPIAMALTSLIKTAFPVVEGRWSPSVAFVVGAGLSLAVGGVTFMESSLLGGIVVGLMACGLYSAPKATFAAVQ